MRLNESSTDNISDFSQQLSKILSSRKTTQNKTQPSFSISEEEKDKEVEIFKKEEKKEDLHEKEQILKELKNENEEIFEQTEKIVDPNQDILNKIIEVDHEEPEENIDDYISKLEQD